MRGGICGMLSPGCRNIGKRLVHAAVHLFVGRARCEALRWSVLLRAPAARGVRHLVGMVAVVPLVPQLARTVVVPLVPQRSAHNWLRCWMQNAGWLMPAAGLASLVSRLRGLLRRSCRK